MVDVMEQLGLWLMYDMRWSALHLFCAALKALKLVL